MGKTETSTQRKRRLEKRKLKRKEKLATESDDAKRQRLSKRRDQDNSETHTRRQLKLDKAKQRMQRLRAVLLHKTYLSLLKDIIIDIDAQIFQEDLIRITQAVNNENAQNNNQALLKPATVSAVGEAANTNDAYKITNNSIRILRASWHQGNNQVFNTNHAGSQCCAMVFTRAAILSPHS
ncbi:hypothetical protein TNCT_216051 [Trichonephila clavata]|uniref:Uncharacterized protein n=1 Tax=Trichonephila clavata TaxID=2740835 RepID=A0A8X6HRA1_TRICU|nr:hypothetical protein TNCT_216051 [Trichonephila clavata]